MGSGLKVYTADLHVHTVLSPCAAVDMIPPLIVQKALAKGIDLIAVADHNASANVEAVQKAAAGTGLHVLPGMELQTYEEVHLLCLFDSLAQLEAWQAMVDALMPAQENRPEFFGEQFVVDETGEWLRTETQLLATSADIPLETAVLEATKLGALAVPAHVDRPTFSLLANLGFVPAGMPIDALEISCHIKPANAQRMFPQLAGYPLIQSGDVHHLDDFCGTTLLTLAAPTIAEIRLALHGRDGRSVTIRD